MAAPTHRPPLLLFLFASACASTHPESAERTAEPAAVGRAQTPYAPPAPPADDEFADFEDPLEAYEQQLAANENRLRSMGVRIAAREQLSAEAEAAGSSRFAPPPAGWPGASSEPAKVAEAEDRADKASPPSGPDKASPPSGPDKAKQPSRPKQDPRRTRPTGGAGRSNETTSASPPAPTQAPRADVGGSPGDASTTSRPEPRPEAKSTSERDKDDRGRCAELCELADSTCDLEGKICDLAARHPGEPRYAEVCRRADEDCRIAAEACTVCSP